MNCENCGKNLYANATSCSCGWSLQKVVRNPPPNVLDTLTEEITRIGMHRFREFPAGTALEFARYWVALNSKPDAEREAPHEVATIAKDGTRWICPYHNRLMATLRAFALMSPADRKIVLAGIQNEKVWWRGELVKHYLNIVNETKRMRTIGIKAYREAAMKSAKKVLAEKIVVDLEANIERAAIQAEGE